MPIYDVIVVGTRCAGAPLAMLLAREGFHVLAVDRDAFPCDTLSTAFMQQGAVRRLREWGLFEPFVASCPAAPRIQRNFWNGEEVDPYPAPEGSAHFSPRRDVLDGLLARTASEAGAEVRTGVTVRGLLRDTAGRVNGVELRSQNGEEWEARARIVAGADGRNSFVARQTGADEYHVVEGTSCTFYSYYRGLPLDEMQVHFGTDHVVYSMPTHGGEVCFAFAAPARNYHTIRVNPAAYAYAMVRDQAPSLLPAFERAEQSGRWYGSAPRRSFFRTPWGPGWALAGDAGYLKDPVLGTGIDDAFSDAARLGSALAQGLRGELEMDTALANYHRERDEAAKPLYDLVCDFARLEGVTEDMLNRASSFEL